MTESSDETKKNTSQQILGTCFFISPETPTHQRDALCGEIAEAAQEFRLNVDPWFESVEPGPITFEIIEKLVKSRLVFADITGSNANVIYEVATAHALAIPVVSVSFDFELKNPTFDIKDQRVIRVKFADGQIQNQPRLRDQIKRSLTGILENPNKFCVTPVATYAVFNGWDKVYGRVIDFYKRRSQRETYFELEHSQGRSEQEWSNLARENFLAPLSRAEASVGTEVVSPRHKIGEIAWVSKDSDGTTVQIKVDFPNGGSIESRVEQGKDYFEHLYLKKARGNTGR